MRTLSTSTLARRLAAAFVMAVVIWPCRPPKLFAQQAAVPGLVQQAPTGLAPQGPVLPLTMDEAVRMGMDNNLALRSARIDLDRADQGIAGARAAFLPQLSASFNRRSSLQPPQGIFQPTDFTNLSLTSSTTISQTLSFYGGSYSASWGTGRTTTDELFPSFNPSLSSSLNLSFQQPLWRNFKIDGLRAGIETSVRSRSIADLNVERQTLATEVQVRNAYLNLVAALESLKVAELNLKTSQDALAAARARVDVGVSPQLEIINQEVTVLANREGVIAAQQNIQNTEDVLRSLILDPARPDYWTVSLQPTDQIRIPEQPSINLQQAIDNALANRIDMRILKLQLENTDFNLRVSKNATLPSLNLNLAYNANGNAGVLWRTDQETFERTVLRDTSFTQALLDSFGGGYPTWSIGASFQYPLGRNSAIASHTSNLLAKRQQEMSLQQLQLGVVADVRAAARILESSYQRFEVLKARLEAATRQEEAEQKKYAVGLSSTLDLQNVQTQLTSARTAELNARIAYMRALIDFETVQRIN